VSHGIWAITILTAVDLSLRKSLFVKKICVRWQEFDYKTVGFPDATIKYITVPERHNDASSIFMSNEDFDNRRRI